MNPLHWLQPLEEPAPRWMLSIGAAGAILLFLPTSSWELRLLSAWDVGVLVLLLLIWLMMLNANAEQTCVLARRQEMNHQAIFLLVIFVAFASLFVIAGVLARNKDLFTPEVGLSIVAIFGSWLLLHTMFTLHYAAFYYREPTAAEFSEINRNAPNTELSDASALATEIPYLGGLEFSDGAPPSYLDFVYFTFTLGMTSQTSDVQIVSSAMRRLALGHTVVSFYFYSVILALAVSII